MDFAFNHARNPKWSQAVASLGFIDRRFASNETLHEHAPYRFPQLSDTFFHQLDFHLLKREEEISTQLWAIHFGKVTLRGSRQRQRLTYSHSLRSTHRAYCIDVALR
jgi:hypothetical protein